MKAKTVQIVATIGPSSQSKHMLTKLTKAGMTIARINTKYASVSECLQITQDLRRNGFVKVLLDIKGKSYISHIQKIKPDYVAVSFAQHGKHIQQVRKQLNDNSIKIIAKIESPAAIKNLKSLIDCSDGIMIARGDLGRNVPMTKLPLFQKEIIKACNKRQCFVITATEMLLSMVHSKTPERAELSDVVNAVLDGTDAVMLSEETSIGKYPDEAVKMMRELVDSAQKWMMKNRKLICS